MFKMAANGFLVTKQRRSRHEHYTYVIVLIVLNFHLTQNIKTHTGPIYISVIVLNTELIFHFSTRIQLHVNNMAASIRALHIVLG